MRELPPAPPRTSSLRFWVVVPLAAALLLVAWLPSVHAAPLDPNAFASLGNSPFGSPGTYTINASKNNANPTLSGPGIAGAINGVFHDPTPGDPTNKNEIAVFTFNSISIAAGITVNGVQNANSRPIALLSKSSVIRAL